MESVIDLSDKLVSAPEGVAISSLLRSHQSAHQLVLRRIAPNWSHRVYTLIGLAWPVYGFIFLCLLCSTNWFSLPFSITALSPLVVLAALIIGHLIALVLECDLLTRLLFPFKHGMPLIFYRRFCTVVEAVEAVENGRAAEGSPGKLWGHPAIVFGRKRILFSAVDELYLTLLGTLELRSFASSGHVFAGPQDKEAVLAIASINAPDVLARLPMSALSLSAQKDLVALFQANNPHIALNDRLVDRLKSPIVKGQNLIQSFGAALIIFALCDVTYATFTWLDMLKGYYGAQICMRRPQSAAPFLAAGEKPEVAKARAEQLFAQAEQLRQHPAPLSWAYRALFANANSQAQLLAIKAESLYRLGRLDEAIKVLEEELKLKSTGFRARLALVRYLVLAGRKEEAQKVLAEIIEKHKDVLLPRVYSQALLLETSPADEPAAYRAAMAELDEESFGEEPAWPPGGEKTLMEMWKRDDLTFIGERLLLKKN